MTDSLHALAREIARELAARDVVSRDVATRDVATRDAPAREAGSRDVTRGGPPEHHATAVPLVPRHPSIAGAPEFAAAPWRDSPVAPPPGVTFVRDNARIADFIDHTLLKAESTSAEIDTLCDEAREHRFAAVCVNPVWVARCAERLRGTPVQVATVIGFPLGANASETKRREAALAVEQGATELDMVVAVGHVKRGDWNHVADDIAAVVDGAAGRLVKVIIESAALTPVEVIKTCAIAREMRAQYVKTSTGFHAAGGATAEAVALMRLVVGDTMGVKASGGVRDCAAALRMIMSGATRIGTSSGVSMAKCLGQGPLPLHDLLTLASSHSPACATCTPGGERAAGSGTY